MSWRGSYGYFLCLIEYVQDMYDNKSPNTIFGSAIEYKKVKQKMYSPINYLQFTKLLEVVNP